MREVSGGACFSQDSLIVEFGLAQNQQADSIEIRWPSGQVDKYQQIPANQTITVKEGLGIISGMPVQPQGKTLAQWGRIKKTALFQNYLNPFNPETWIPYQLGKPSKVMIRIYNAQGQLVRTFDLGHRAAGFYLVRSRAAYWDGRNERGERVGSGVYFYHISDGDFSSTRRMLVVK